jgi:hypothetical protein
MAPPVPLAGQVPVTATHLPPEQQPPVQVLPAQQMSPRFPHLAHTPSLVVVVHALPAVQGAAAPPAGQQDSPEFPHEAQAPFLHESPS